MRSPWGDRGCSAGTADGGRAKAEKPGVQLGCDILYPMEAEHCPLPSPDECGIVAQISEPLAAADIPAYYISTFKFDHALVSVQHQPPGQGSQFPGLTWLHPPAPRRYQKKTLMASSVP